MTAGGRLLAAAALCVALLQPAAAGGTDLPDPDTGALIRAALERYAAQADFDVERLSDDDVSDLLDGHAIIRAAAPARDPAGDTRHMGILGLQYVDAPRLLAWLTLLGGGGRGDGRVTYAKLAEYADGSYARYQHVDLPWPVRDRHWVIWCRKNVALAKATDGAIWEHHWALHPEGKALLAAAGEQVGLDRRTLDASIYLPENRGTWAVFDLGRDRTLILAWYDADLGGLLPGGLVRRFTARQLRNYLEATRELSGNVLHFYDGTAPIRDGFGKPISRRDALDVARAWHGG